MAEERSPSGQPIYRHESRAPGSLAPADVELVEAVEAHLGATVGTPAWVFHEILSEDVHVDVHVVEPGDDRPEYMLMTSGMAQRPMVGRDGEARHAELTMGLPATWDVENVQWPFGLLQFLAHLPHAYETVLWSGHTVPNDDPPQPWAKDTELCGALLAPPVTAPDGFSRFAAGDRDVRVLGVYLLHADEMKLKLDRGTDALYDLLEEAGVTETVDLQRPSVVGRRRRGLFRR
jgi:hypothetical protein